HEQDPISAPVSPSLLRRISSQAEDDQTRTNLRTGRRKLGSRHGWALGRGRGGISHGYSLACVCALPKQVPRPSGNTTAAQHPARTALVRRAE
ncbi:hypothetical protein M9458_028409, partial [Cirrhinus mrigala]